MTRTNDPLDLTLRELLASLLREHPPSDPDPWVDLRKEGWPCRRIAEAAKRGECKVSRVGRRLLMRRSELNAWIDRHQIEVEPDQERAAPPSRIAHLLESADHRSLLARRRKP
jgi:hypothetical protein